MSEVSRVGVPVVVDGLPDAEVEGQPAAPTRIAPNEFVPGGRTPAFQSGLADRVLAMLPTSSEVAAALEDALRVHATQSALQHDPHLTGLDETRLADQLAALGVGRVVVEQIAAATVALTRGGPEVGQRLSALAETLRGLGPQGFQGLVATLGTGLAAAIDDLPTEIGRALRGVVHTLGLATADAFGADSVRLLAATLLPSLGGSGAPQLTANLADDLDAIAGLADLDRPLAGFPSSVLERYRSLSALAASQADAAAVTQIHASGAMLASQHGITEADRDQLIAALQQAGLDAATASLVAAAALADLEAIGGGALLALLTDESADGLPQLVANLTAALATLDLPGLDADTVQRLLIATLASLETTDGDLLATLIVTEFDALGSADQIKALLANLAQALAGRGLTALDPESLQLLAAATLAFLKDGDASGVLAVLIERLSAFDGPLGSAEDIRALIANLAGQFESVDLETLDADAIRLLIATAIATGEEGDSTLLATLLIDRLDALGDPDEVAALIANLTAGLDGRDLAGIDVATVQLAAAVALATLEDDRGALGTLLAERLAAFGDLDQVRAVLTQLADGLRSQELGPGASVLVQGVVTTITGAVTEAFGEDGGRRAIELLGPPLAATLAANELPRPAAAPEVPLLPLAVVDQRPGPAPASMDSAVAQDLALVMRARANPVLPPSAEPTLATITEGFAQIRQEQRDQARVARFDDAIATAFAATAMPQAALDRTTAALASAPGSNQQSAQTVAQAAGARLTAVDPAPQPNPVIPLLRDDLGQTQLEQALPHIAAALGATAGQPGGPALFAATVRTLVEGAAAAFGPDVARTVQAALVPPLAVALAGAEPGTTGTAATIEHRLNQDFAALIRLTAEPFEPDRWRAPASVMLEEARRAHHLSVHRETAQDLHQLAATVIHQLPQVQVEELIREMAQFMRWDAGGAVNLFGAVHAQTTNEPIYATQLLTVVERFQKYDDLRELEADLDRLRQFVQDDPRPEVRNLALGVALTLTDAATQAFGEDGGLAVEQALVPPLADWLGGATDGAAAG